MKLLKSICSIFFLSLLIVNSVSATTVTSFLPKTSKQYTYKSVYYNNHGKSVGSSTTKEKHRKVGNKIIKGYNPKDPYQISHWIEDRKKGIYFVSGPDTAAWKKSEVLDMIKAKEAELYLKYPVKKGAKWKGNYGTQIQGDYQVKKYSSQVVSKNMVVKTSFKTYKNVIKVKTNYQGYTVNRYFVKGIGLIKEEGLDKVKGKSQKIFEITLTNIK